MKSYSIIREGESAQALVSERGGHVISYIRDGEDIIYLQRPKGSKLRGGIPICFPFFGPSPEGFSEISQHGWLRNEMLDLWKEEPSNVRFRGVNHGRADYPWKLEYLINTALRPDGLELELEVYRLSDGIDASAPINPAFHPYFANLGEMTATVGQQERMVYVGQDETFSLQENKIIVINLGKKKVQMILGGDFGGKSCLTLWTDGDKYFCVEPSLTHPNQFGTLEGVYLNQGETLILTCAIKILQ